MARAYEYVVSYSANFTTFIEDLASRDAEGWEVVAFSPTTAPGGTVSLYALLRRRLED